MPDHHTRLLTAQLMLHGLCGTQNNSVNIRVQLEMMLGGVTPSRVDCVGHSLGGGLATICGPWAAEQWPGADVRCISPLLFEPQFLLNCSSQEGGVMLMVQLQTSFSSDSNHFFFCFAGVIKYSPTLP